MSQKKLANKASRISDALRGVLWKKKNSKEKNIKVKQKVEQVCSQKVIGSLFKSPCICSTDTKTN